MNELRYEKAFSIAGGRTSTATCIIPPYIGLTVRRSAVELGKREVELEVQRRCIRYAVYQRVDDCAGINDMVNIDFLGYLNGQPFDDGKIEGFDLRLGSGTFIAGFEEQIIGHRANEHFEISVTFPTEYPVQELQGQQAAFAITLNQVKHLTVPIPSDEIAQKEGYADLDEMTQAIRQHRIELHRKKQDDKLREVLLAKVVRTAQTTIPQPLLTFTIGQLEQQLAGKLTSSNLTQAQFLARNRMTTQNLQEQLRERAVNAVTKQLVVDGIAEREGLLPTLQEIDSALETYLKSPSVKGCRKTSQLKVLMRERLCCHKVSAFLLAHAVEEN